MMDSQFVIVGYDGIDPDTVFVVDPNSVEWNFELHQQGSTVDGEQRFELLMQVVGKDKVVETNPFHWHRPHHLGSLIGYYYRKVTGKLRYHESINAVKLVGLWGTK